MAQKFILSGLVASQKGEWRTLLSQKGYLVMPSEWDLLIQEQEKLPNPILPWTHPRHFAHLCLGRMWKQHERADKYLGICFLENGLPDLMAWLAYARVSVEPIFYQQLEQSNYQKSVFLMPPRQENFSSDSNNPWTYAQLEEVYQQFWRTYQQLGFQIIEISTKSTLEQIHLIEQKLD